MRWTHHDDRPNSDDLQTECLTYEAVMDPVYGHYTIQVCDTGESLGEVLLLADATPLIEQHQKETAT